MTAETTKQEELSRLLEAAVFANEGKLYQEDGEWRAEGDKVDTALLAMAHKADRSPEDILKNAAELGRIFYSSKQKYAAAFYEVEGKPYAYVKGAVETLLPMCARGVDGKSISENNIEELEQALAGVKYRVIGFAYGEVKRKDEYSSEDLENLTFLGMIGFVDPLRENAREAVEKCRDAGLTPVMITGDQPDTAFAIARELDLCNNRDDVVTGRQFKNAADQGEKSLDELTGHARVYARTEPDQKQKILESVTRGGGYVAMTGDGVNDAPALKHAHVGVAMGKSGTDVARESADIIITDDNFASIINGVEEGRIAYSNIRKAIFFLVSCGLAEVLLFYLATAFAVAPAPLLAVQLLWINVITNGVQDIALAFEPGEGDELSRQPRNPDERIFNGVMIGRILILGVIGGISSFGVFYYSMEYAGYAVEEARNLTILYYVLFENVNAFNSKSETKSVFHINPLNNKFLIVGIAAALGLHIFAMYWWGWLAGILHVSPVGIKEWGAVFSIAVLAIAASEAEKYLRRKRGKPWLGDGGLPLDKWLRKLSPQGKR
ncbi:MAG TPA: hypothetical protein DCO82_08700 [Alphaproteobacteria bacterium]|jgi:P-type Ca2+ transporter type 2C|nr:hypothetical protein [Alphaproteobacteria bacterium]